MRQSTHSGHWVPQIARVRRCKEGFYLLIGNRRSWYPSRHKAIQALNDILSDLKIGVVSVRNYQGALKPSKFHRWEKP